MKISRVRKIEFPRPSKAYGTMASLLFFLAFRVIINSNAFCPLCIYIYILINVCLKCRLGLDDCRIDREGSNETLMSGVNLLCMFQMLYWIEFIRYLFKRINQWILYKSQIRLLNLDCAKSINVQHSIRSINYNNRVSNGDASKIDMPPDHF